MIIDYILSGCDSRFEELNCGHCVDCSYGDYCPHDCEKCLDYIHNPSHAPDGAPERKYDCAHMADFYTCKYACRYTSEIIYALRRFRDLINREHIKVKKRFCHNIIKQKNHTIQCRHQYKKDDGNFVFPQTIRKYFSFHFIIYPAPGFVMITPSSPLSSNFLRSRLMLTVRVFSST